MSMIRLSAKKTLLAGCVAIPLFILSVWFLWTSFSRANHPGHGTPSEQSTSSDQSYPSGNHEDDPNEEDQPRQVRVIKPIAGGMERVSVQPGTLHAFQYVDVFAKVSGFLRHQKVDIGDPVKKREIMAEIYAPELIEEEKHAAAKLDLAKAQVRQAKALVEEAQADLKAVQMLVTQRQAEVLRAKANLQFRTIQRDRFIELDRKGAIDGRLVDEQFKEWQAAQSGRDAAEAAVLTTQAEVEAKKAKIIRAKADLSAAQSNVEVAEADLEKAHVFVEFTRVRSPYNGVVVKRTFHDDAFIRDPEHGGNIPLLVVQRTDLMRLIVQVPDSDARFVEPGLAAEMTVSTLPGEVFPGLKVSRTAHAQDEMTRTMRVEIVVPNPDKACLFMGASAAGLGGSPLADGPWLAASALVTRRTPDTLLRDGMFANVTIHLKPANKDAFQLPVSCVHRKGNERIVYVVRDSVIQAVPVEVIRENGDLAEIKSELQPDDCVVRDSPAGFHEGQIVGVVHEGID